MKYVLYIVFSFLLSKVNGQDTCTLVSNMECINEKFKDNNFFILGEMHFRDTETSIVQLELLEKIISRGEKKIKVYLELPPSSTYFLSKYYESGDSIWMEEKLLYENFIPFVNGLIKYKEQIEVNFVSIDLEFNDHFKVVKEFIEELINDSLDTPFKKVYKIKCRKKLLEIITKEYNNSIFHSKYSDILNKEDFKLFSKELELLTKYGFIKGVSKKSREEWMSSVIEKEYDSSICHMLTIGRAHISSLDNVPPTLISEINGLKRGNFILIPIVYPSSLWLKYNNIFYKKDNDFKMLVNRNIFDLIYFIKEKPIDTSLESLIEGVNAIKEESIER